MNEPANLTGWTDRFGNTWVRVDDCPDGPGETWWLRQDRNLTRPKIQYARSWDSVDREWGPLSPADPDLTAETIALVWPEVAR